jgi:hypothetical protein
MYSIAQKSTFVNVISLLNKAKNEKILVSKILFCVAQYCGVYYTA